MEGRRSSEERATSAMRLKTRWGSLRVSAPSAWDVAGILLALTCLVQELGPAISTARAAAGHAYVWIVTGWILSLHALSIR